MHVQVHCITATHPCPRRAVQLIKQTATMTSIKSQRGLQERTQTCSCFSCTNSMQSNHLNDLWAEYFHRSCCGCTHTHTHTHPHTHTHTHTHTHLRLRSDFATPSAVGQAPTVAFWACHGAVRQRAGVARLCVQVSLHAENPGQPSLQNGTERNGTEFKIKAPTYTHFASSLIQSIS